MSRGPFHDGRIIDLSYAAAVKLDFHRQGTANVLMEVLAPEPTGPEAYMLQAGAFRALSGADATKAELEQLTGLEAFIVRTNHDGLYRVQLGPVAVGPELAKVEALLISTGYGKPRRQPARPRG